MRSNNDFWKEVASALENACATVGQPPSSVKISGLELTSKASVSQGEIGDIWEGQHNGAAVAIKSVKVYSRSEADIILQVCIPSPWDSALYFNGEFLLESMPRTCDLEKTRTPAYSGFFRCMDTG